MNGTCSFCVISRRRPATSMTSASLSTTQGPAIKNSGRSAPTSNDPSFMTDTAPKPWRGRVAATHGRRAPHE